MEIARLGTAAVMRGISRHSSEGNDALAFCSIGVTGSEVNLTYLGEAGARVGGRASRCLINPDFVG